MSFFTHAHFYVLHVPLIIMALTHTILQFNLEERASAAAYSALNEIEQILLRHGLQGRVTETFRANAKPLLMFLSDGGR